MRRRTDFYAQKEYSKVVTTPLYDQATLYKEDKRKAELLQKKADEEKAKKKAAEEEARKRREEERAAKAQQ
jgi:hypothetical protein